MYRQKINNYQLQDHERVMHTTMALRLVAKTMTNYKRPLTSRLHQKHVLYLQLLRITTVIKHASYE